MFDNAFQRIAEIQTRRLLGGEEQVSFSQMVTNELPMYLWGSLKLLFDPQLGGTIQAGGESFSFVAGIPDKEQLGRLHKQLQSGWYLAHDEIRSLVLGALNLHLDFLIDPAASISGILSRRHQGTGLEARQTRAALDSIDKLLNRWNPAMLHAVETVKPYLQSLGEREILEDELKRLFRSALEKEVSTNPLEAVEQALESLRALFRDDPEGEEPSSGEFSGVIGEILRNYGLTSWVAAIEVEDRLENGRLGFDTALKALHRLNEYRKRGILDEDSEATRQVEEEVEDFSRFIKEVTE